MNIKYLVEKLIFHSRLKACKKAFRFKLVVDERNFNFLAFPIQKFSFYICDIECTINNLPDS